MGQTRVDLLHLLEDLRDAYPGSLEETIVTETVANALDSGATRITLRADPAAATLTIADDGAGMTRAQLRRYHDLASTSKRRGRGIGFAGVGIKLALLACDDVVTESRRAGRAHASAWRLASRHRAPWNWIEPPGLVDSPAGTAVRLHLANTLSPLLDPAWLEAALIRHCEPLFDPAFDEILAAAYPAGVRFAVNGREIERADGARAALPGNVAAADVAHVAARLPRKRKPSALGWLVRAAEPLPRDESGLAISTLGKVIRRGWDWLGMAPDAADRIRGLVEAPGLAAALQLNKADFIRQGARGATYLAFRKAIQESVAAQLELWGDAPEPGAARRTRTRPIERDLESVLVDLANDFPLLGALVERRAGGQRRIPFGSRRTGHDGWAPAFAIAAAAEAEPDAAPATGPQDAEPAAGRPQDAEPPGPAEPSEPTPPAEPPPDAALPGSAGRKRPGRYGLQIRFESRPDDPQLGRLVESTVWVNDAHPAWRRAAAARAEGYHIALTVAMSLAPLAVEPAAAHDFITTFLHRWGEAAEIGKRTRRGRARTRRR